MYDSLLPLLKNQIGAFGKKTLQEQQQYRLYAAIRAYMKVVQKNLTDAVMASITREVLDVYQPWLHGLPLAEEILGASRESDSIVNTRVEKKDEYASMKECLRILNVSDKK